jgi:hypothetical protein
MVYVRGKAILSILSLCSGRIIEPGRGICPPTRSKLIRFFPLTLNLNSPQRRLIALRMEHGDLDALIDQAADKQPADELMMRRLKKRRLALRDEIARVEQDLMPDEPA